MGKDKFLDQFEIPFPSLAIGRHQYVFELNAKFFETLEHPEIRECQITVKLDLDRQKTMLVCAFDISGTAEFPCDRCGELFNQPIAGLRHLVVRLDSDSLGDEDDLISLSPSDHVLNVAQFMYEYVTLLVPSRRVHPEGGCDPEMLKKISDLSVGEDHPHDDDPRWQALKNIKFKS